MDIHAKFGGQRKGRTKMTKHKYLIAGAILAVLFWFAPTQIWAGPPEGVKMEVIAEYPSVDVGIEKIQLVKFTFQPGAIIKNLPVANTSL